MANRFYGHNLMQLLIEPLCANPLALRLVKAFLPNDP